MIFNKIKYSASFSKTKNLQNTKLLIYNILKTKKAPFKEIVFFNTPIVSGYNRLLSHQDKDFITYIRSCKFLESL